MLVDPTHLRTAAQTQAEVGTFVASLTTGQSLTDGAAGVSGLLSGAACQLAGSVLDSAANSVHDALTDHSTKLAAAAEHYQQMDEEFGRRLRAFAP